MIKQLKNDIIALVHLIYILDYSDDILTYTSTVAVVRIYRFAGNNTSKHVLTVTMA